jgi:hypothetical protein
MRWVPVRQEGAWKEGATGTHAAPPNIGIRSTDNKAWVREAHFNLHVAGLWVAVHDAENGIRAIVMRVTLD